MHHCMYRYNTAFESSSNSSSQAPKRPRDAFMVAVSTSTPSKKSKSNVPKKYSDEFRKEVVEHFIENNAKLTSQKYNISEVYSYLLLKYGLLLTALHPEANLSVEE